MLCRVFLQALQLQDGMPLTCASGYCVPQQRPDLLQVCAAGTGRDLPGPMAQAGQPAAAPTAQAGRRLLAWVRVCLMVRPNLPFLCPTRGQSELHIQDQQLLCQAPISISRQDCETRACDIRRLS